MEAVLEALKRLDWSPLYISIRTGIVATIISFFLGIFAARKVLKASDKVRAAADGILTMPLVLPPTVAGFFLLLFFSRRRPLGILLYERFGIKVVQSWLGCIIAATVIAFPLMYRNARAAFEYGATSMLAGNIPGKTATVSQRIAMVIQDGDYVTAGVWTAVVIVIAFAFIFVMNLISAKAVKGGKRW